MERIWQRAWNRYGARYSWAIYAIMVPLVLQIYLVPSFVVVAYEESGHYVEAAAVTGVAVLVGVYLLVLPGLGWSRLAERWAAGQEVDRAEALAASYTYARRVVVRWVAVGAVWTALLVMVVGGIAGASGSRLVQNGILGAVIGAALWLIGVHSLVEGMLRPVRVALVGDTGIGDSQPRSRPSFAAGTSMSVLAVAFSFAVSGAMLAAVFGRASEGPVLWLVIGCALTLFFAVPMKAVVADRHTFGPFGEIANGSQGRREIGADGSPGHRRSWQWSWR
jgi:adenylate cyclase